MRPLADELTDGGNWVEAFDVTVEQTRLVLLIADDPVAPAPPDLERHTAECNLPRPVERAAGRVSAGIRRRRPADLATREALQSIAVGKAIERPISRRHVRRCVERSCAGKQSWKPGEEE